MLPFFLNLAGVFFFLKLCREDTPLQTSPRRRFSLTTPPSFNPAYGPDVINKNRKSSQNMFKLGIKTNWRTFRWWKNTWFWCCWYGFEGTMCCHLWRCGDTTCCHLWRCGDTTWCHLLTIHYTTLWWWLLAPSSGWQFLPLWWRCFEIFSFVSGCVGALLLLQSCTRTSFLSGKIKQSFTLWPVTATAGVNTKFQGHLTTEVTVNVNVISQGSHKNVKTKFPDFSLTFPWLPIKFPWPFYRQLIVELYRM